jgi:hypothetical protein
MASTYTIAVSPSVYQTLQRHILERKVNLHDGNPLAYWRASASTMIDFLMNYYEVVRKAIHEATKAEAFTKRGVLELDFQDIFNRAIAYNPRKKAIDSRQTMNIALEDMIRMRSLWVTKFGFEPGEEMLKVFAETVIRQERLAAKAPVLSDLDLPNQP